jgi:hypothetical protein
MEEGATIPGITSYKFSLANQMCRVTLFAARAFGKRVAM